MSPEDRARLEELVNRQIWIPLSGPQMLAYKSKADFLFYGGSPGGGKTDLILGLAATQHLSSIVFRRDAKQLQKIEQRALQLYGQHGEYHGTDRVWSIKAGGADRIVEFGGVHDNGDEQKYMGWPNDLKAFDEVCHFTEYQFRFLTTWTRTTVPGQRTRVIAAGNPPMDSVGMWVIDFWGPWLDKKHPNPAQPGELRWFTTLDGKDTEVPDGTPFEHKGVIIYPKSRTFIPAFLSDNPYLDTPDYRGMLQALPEPMRSQMLNADFTAGREDDAWQVIPTAWVLQAQVRWRNQAKPNLPLTKLGVDIARGGSDQTIVTARYGTWFDKQITRPGSSTPNGGAVVQVILPVRGTSKCTVNFDVINVGGSVYDILNDLKIPCAALNGSAGTEATDSATGTIGFHNKRAEWYWRMREALDPVHGQFLALPDDRELLADLCAPRYKITAQGILIEDKKAIMKRIGRSPDKGDSAVYALAEEAPTATTVFGSF